MTIRWASTRLAGILVTASVVGTLAACSGSNSNSEPSPSPTVTASSEASGAADTLGTYQFDLKTVKMEPSPAWAGQVEMDKKDPLYVSGTDLEGAITIEMTLNKTGQFITASGKGVLWNGTSSVDFTISQGSVLMSAKLSGDETLLYGALQAETKSGDKKFAFDIRLLPDSKEMELRLPNGKGVVVFGESPGLAKHADEVKKLAPA